MKIEALKALCSGTASGQIAPLSAPLSLWGGLSLEDGMICDVNHPDYGLSLAGKVLAMPAARGSSSSSSALAEAARRKVAPVAIILGQADPILTIGSLVTADLYGVHIPIVLVPENRWGDLPVKGIVTVQSDGNLGCLRFPSKGE
ncbi:aconitase X swivel domain-containing protein [Sphingomonas melonis]|uniref:aconitase X swivel domain-containing protein n=1 Tax=Sphingomonas melonis TaxID=152682 RepID=UPI0015C97A4C